MGGSIKLTCFSKISITAKWHNLRAKRGAKWGAIRGAKRGAKQGQTGLTLLKNVNKTSWDCTGLSSAQTGTGTLFYLIQDLLHKIE